MTFYDFLKIELKGHRDRKADYLRADVNWLANVSKRLELSEQVLNSLESLPRKIRESEELSNDEKCMVSRIFMGDSKYLSANRAWMKESYIQKMIEIGEKKTDKEFENIAEKYDNTVEKPDFSRPEDIWDEEERKLLENLSFTQEAIVASTVTSLDWIEYLLEGITPDIEIEVIERAKKQSIFLVEDIDKMDDDVLELISEVFYADINWLNELEEDFNFTAPLAQFICRKMSEKNREIKEKCPKNIHTK